MPAAGPTWTIILRDTPAGTQLPLMSVRVRRLLKFALRYLGLRCVSAVENKPEPDGPADARPEPR